MQILKSKQYAEVLGDETNNKEIDNANANNNAQEKKDELFLIEKLEE